VAVVGTGLASVAQGAYLTVYGSPAYDANTNDGFKMFDASGVNDSGTAVGWGAKYVGGVDKGHRAVRWDGSGAAATELGNLGTDSGGNTFVEVDALNASGTAVGWAYKYVGGVYVGDRAVQWNAGSTTAIELSNLGTDSNGFTEVHASAINDAGTVVGYARKFFGGSGTRAVRWKASNAAAVELGDLGTDSNGYTRAQASPLASAINAPGTAVGWAYKYVGGIYRGGRAVRWDASGTTATELGNLGTDSNGYAWVQADLINASGVIVGSASKYNGDIDLSYRTVRWDAGSTVATELDNLGTDSNGSTLTWARGINATGTIVGGAYKYVGGVYMGARAVRWDASGTAATELGNLGTDSNGYTWAAAGAMNASGIAVGAADKYVDGNHIGQRAVYWGLDGLAVDLNTLIDPNSGWTLMDAETISNTGWVAGWGLYDPDGAGGADAYERLFLVQIPEPASATLLLTGVLAALLKRRRR
jgi:hypothetical protein